MIFGRVVNNTKNVTAVSDILPLAVLEKVRGRLLNNTEYNCVLNEAKKSYEVLKCPALGSQCLLTNRGPPPFQALLRTINISIIL
jgi:hypothetical protein